MPAYQRDTSVTSKPLLRLRTTWTGHKKGAQTAPLFKSDACQQRLAGKR
jgi:hypothetical protein